MKVKINISNKIISTVLVCVLILPISSCRKFLDTPRNSQVSLLSTVADCQAILDAPTMRQGSPQDGQRGTDDYFLTDADYKSLVKIEDKGFYTWLPGTQRLNGRSDPGYDWRIGYRKISDANVALESLDLISDRQSGLEDQNDYKNVRGMGLFIRAFCFYQLATEYSKLYNEVTASQDLGIPTPLSADINMVSKRGTVRETYDRIIQDLNEAKSLLPVISAVEFRPTKVAVDALLARVYLSMGKYTEATTAANDVLKVKSDLINYNDVSKTVDGPFPAWIKEVIYPSEIKSIDKAYVNPDVYVMYPQNDLRKDIFFKKSGNNYTFKGSYTGSTGSYFNGLAVDEIYLIRAECYARAGNTVDAMKDLNTLLVKRWATGTYVNMTANSPADALSKVLTERRKELFMRGLRWADLKRLNKEPDLAVNLSRTVDGVTYNLPANDLRYQLLLPLAVVQNSSLEQNPRPAN